MPAAPGAILDPRTAPTGVYAADTTPLGSNDFRATKQNFTAFSLCDQTDDACIGATSDGQQHVRPWVGDDSIAFLVADLSNVGGNPFSRQHIFPRPTISKGSRVDGVATLFLGNPVDSE